MQFYFYSEKKQQVWNQPLAFLERKYEWKWKSFNLHNGWSPGNGRLGFPSGLPVPGSEQGLHACKQIFHQGYSHLPRKAPGWWGLGIGAYCLCLRPFNQKRISTEIRQWVKGVGWGCGEELQIGKQLVPQRQTSVWNRVFHQPSCKQPTMGLLGRCVQKGERIINLHLYIPAEPCCELHSSKMSYCIQFLQAASFL